MGTIKREHWLKNDLEVFFKIRGDGLVKSRHSGENQSQDGLQLLEKTGFRLSPE